MISFHAHHGHLGERESRTHEASVWETQALPRNKLQWQQKQQNLKNPWNNFSQDLWWLDNGFLS